MGEKQGISQAELPRRSILLEQGKIKGQSWSTTCARVSKLRPIVAYLFLGTEKLKGSQERGRNKEVDYH